jgi:protein TIF31
MSPNGYPASVNGIPVTQNGFPASPINWADSPLFVNVGIGVENKDEAAAEGSTEKSCTEVGNEKPPIEQKSLEDQAVDNQNNHHEVEEKTTDIVSITAAGDTLTLLWQEKLAIRAESKLLV